MVGHTPHKLECFPFYLSSSDSIIHYTCNSPSEKVLERYFIRQRGDEFECANKKEVLEIPFSIYKKFGFSEKINKDVLNINLEKIMRDLK